MPSSLMPKIFRSSKRYADTDRPSVNEQCVFSYCEQLIPGEFVEKAKAFSPERGWIEQGAVVRVIRNALSFVEIRFAGASETDYVDACYLMSRELTDFGRAFCEQNADKMSSRARKYFIGEVE